MTEKEKLKIFTAGLLIGVGSMGVLTNSPYWGIVSAIGLILLIKKIRG